MITTRMPAAQPSKSDLGAFNRAQIRKVVFIYGGVGCFWIVLTDLFISGGLEHFNVLGTLKGLAFVACTALFIHHLLCRAQRQAEQVQNRVIESEENLRAAFETAPDAIFWIDAIEGSVIRCNRAAEHLLGISEKKIIETNRLKQALAREVPLRAMEGNPQETSLSAADGTQRSVRISTSTLQTRGHPVVQAVFHDVTAQREAEKRLHLFERAVESTSNGIIITDAAAPDHPILYVNPAFEKITGYSAAEALGKNCRFLQRSQDNKTERAVIREAIRQGTSCSVRLLNQRKDGGDFWNDLFLSPIFNFQGKVTHFIGIQSDVSEKVLAEQKLAEARDALTRQDRMTALSTLASGLAHEIRNPLATIRICLFSLRRFLENDPDAAQDLDPMELEIDRLNRILQQFVQFSNPVSRSPVPVHVLSLMEEETAKMSDWLRRKKIQLDLDCHPGFTLQMDPDGLHHVLRALLDNACDNCPEEGFIHLRAWQTTAPPKLNRLEVANSGPGIKLENQARIFTPFFTTKPQGTGLNLAIAYQIALGHGGRIEFDSKPGEPTRFRLVLPAP